MKKQISTLALTILFTGIFSFCSAQKATPSKNVSSMGYWVVENNIKTPKSSIIYFYNNNQQLVYRENVEGIRINASRRKVQLRLKHILEESVTAWEQQHISKENQMLVAMAFRK